jgi:hypothetical protein
MGKLRDRDVIFSQTHFPQCTNKEQSDGAGERGKDISLTTAISRIVIEPLTAVPKSRITNTTSRTTQARNTPIRRCASFAADSVISGSSALHRAGFASPSTTTVPKNAHSDPASGAVTMAILSMGAGGAGV